LCAGTIGGLGWSPVHEGNRKEEASAVPRRGSLIQGRPALIRAWMASALGRSTAVTE
ncbi:hypothetical protein NL676_004687, partial [Syzygium grande]